VRTAAARRRRRGPGPPRRPPSSSAPAAPSSRSQIRTPPPPERSIQSSRKIRGQTKLRIADPLSFYAVMDSALENRVGVGIILPAVNLFIFFNL